MSLKTFIEKIGHAFHNLFTGIDHEYHKQQPEFQDALHKAVGIVAFFNNNKDLVPTLLREGILKATGITEAKLSEALSIAAKDVNLLIDIAQPTELQIIEAIQKHLKERTGVAWAKASDTFAKAIAFFLAPAGTKLSMLLPFIVTVYQNYFKKQ